MITNILAKIFGTNNDRELKKIDHLVRQINSFEPEMRSFEQEQFPLKTISFKERLAQGATLDDIMPEAFALVREAARRTLGQRHYDVQLIGGIVLHQGKISEMKTGEGKTLTATLPLYLNALTSKGVHLVTVNDYLAQRDSQWMKPVYNFLGLSVACLQNSMDDSARKEAYSADILYATNNELGFDYLRDNMKFRLTDYVQRELFYAIVDEVDSILIDEARTPLIISGSADESSSLYAQTNDVIARFSKETDYTVDEKERTVFFTEQGVDKIEAAFGVSNLYAIENINILHHCKQALKAHVIFKKDIDYVVQDNEVLIVDEFTGRILAGRRYSDGLHQALEAKEKVTIEKESHTLAAITLQNYFRMYKKLAGMTGTALTESEEFYAIYKLPVIAIPTNQMVIRKDYPDLIFLSQHAKFKAIVEDVKARYEKKQPVLIGTVAVETSELLSAILTAQGIKHNVLNAKQHAREAEIVENAGKPGMITIATNMAGRGTDIKLTQESKECGGLYILGTERHESRRIDNQLRGRSGRQGDAGESRFYISLDDDLIRRFAGENLKKNMQRFGMKEDEVIESPYVSKIIESAQERVEKQNFEVRKHLIEYDDVLNQQRKVIYNQRRSVLEENMQEGKTLIHDFIASTADSIILAHTNKHNSIESKELEEIYTHIAALSNSPVEIVKERITGSTQPETMSTQTRTFLLEQYDSLRLKEQSDVIKNAEKWLMLETIDQAWKQHMLNLDRLKEGINLRSWGQKTPLIEYKREAFGMFTEMIHAITTDIVRHVFHLNTHHFNAQELEEKRQQELDEISMISANQQDDTPSLTREEPKIGRNDDCPCASGKKYKKCCG